MLGQALLASMQRHCWYLSKKLVLLALADDDIELELKSKILDKLLYSEVPDLSCFFFMLTEQSDLVGLKSWLLLKVAVVPKGEA
jgi:hypothetical protein